MHPNKLAILFLVMALLVSYYTVTGQTTHTKAKFRTRAVQRARTASVPASAQYAFDFHNINRKAYYQDNKILDEIEKHERKKEWQPAYELLTQYVKNFGIQNFYRDTHLLWRLARYIEQFDDIEKAKHFYRLILKHHRGDLVRVQQHFDSLSEYDAERYVPIEYYYELVEYRKAIDTLRPPVGVLLNMGEGVNSEQADYGPTLGGDNRTLFITSKRNVQRVGGDMVANEDIYYTRKLTEDYWEDAQPLSSVNSRYNEGSARITRNGRTMYFARCQSPDGYGNCDIFVAELQADSTWGNIRNLGAQINSTAWDSHPALSHNEDTLYFASDRMGGFGLSDIYFSYKNPDGMWTAAQNLGPVINTRQNEVSPFFHPTFNVLYFSSNGQLLNFGDFDIYKCYRMGDQWIEPISIGPLVNGKGSEYYFTIDSESKNLYYGRSEADNIKNLDLYSFPLPMEAQPEAITKLTGSVRDSATGDPFTGIVSVIDLTSGIEVAPKYLRPDGSYSFDLIKEKDYLVIVTGDDFFRVERTFRLIGDTAIHIVTPSIDLKKWAFASVEFDEGSAAIKTNMHSDLNKVVGFLVDHPNFHLKISGHTDSDGNVEANKKLSQQRANSIKNYIVQQGQFDTSRIEALGYGNTQPIVAVEKSDADKRINRRVEFEIFRPK